MEEKTSVVKLRVYIFREAPGPSGKSIKAQRHSSHKKDAAKLHSKKNCIQRNTQKAEEEI